MTYREWREKRGGRTARNSELPVQVVQVVPKLPPRVAPTQTPEELPADVRLWLGHRIEATKKNRGAWTCFPIPLRWAELAPAILANTLATGLEAYMFEHMGNKSITMRG